MHIIYIQCPSKISIWKKLENLFTTTCGWQHISCKSQNPKNHTQTAILNNGLSDSHKLNTKIFLSTSSLLYQTAIMSRLSKKKLLLKFIWKNSIFSLFQAFNFRFQWCPYIGQRFCSIPCAQSTTNTFHYNYNKNFGAEHNTFWSKN